MLLARDRVGKKPLFYHHDGRSLYFASEIKALLATGAVAAEPDPVALHDYLTYLYFPPPRTAFRGIFKLPPATCMSVQVLPSGALQRRQWTYWDPVEATDSPAKLSERDAIAATRELIDEAVRMRLVSDVPLGIFLSGGIDSSTITAFASRHQGRVQTFSIGFRDQRSYNELPFAKLVADRFHTDHHVIEADALCAESLTKVVRHFDEPFGNPTAILEFALTKEMRRHVTVALSGDGADELFGGYERYRGAWLARYYRRLPAFVTRGVMARMSSRIRESTEGQHIYRRVREFAEIAWAQEEEAYLRWVGYFTEADKAALYAPEFASQIRGHDSGEFLRGIFRRGESLAPMNRLGYVDLMSYLPCNCLEYTDRMSMANSLEVRSPFTDHKLVEFALHLPEAFKVHGLGTKWLLRRAMKGILPHEILTKKKTGFTAPAPLWITRELQPLISQLLAPEVVRRRGILRPQSVAQLLRDHVERKRDNAYRIWALMMLEIWLRMYVDKEAESAVHETVVAAATSLVA
jgi:asparagine synthase (glutamine-hydrolysing)